MYRIETFLLLDAAERLDHFLEAQPELAQWNHSMYWLRLLGF
ncbi:hypothetical protein [Haliscomenobacter sp.]